MFRFVNIIMELLLVTWVQFDPTHICRVPVYALQCTSQCVPCSVRGAADTKIMDNSMDRWSTACYAKSSGSVSTLQWKHRKETDRRGGEVRVPLWKKLLFRWVLTGEEEFNRWSSRKTKLSRQRKHHLQRHRGKKFLVCLPFSDNGVWWADKGGVQSEDG